MTETRRLEVGVELGHPLAAWANRAGQSAAAGAVATAVTQLARDLGWPVRAHVTVERCDSPRAVRVRIGGRLRPYSPAVLRRAWCALYPGAAAELPTLWHAGYPDAWVAAVFNRDRSAPAGEDFARFLALVTREVVYSHPSCLVDAADVPRYLATAARSGPPSMLAPSDLVEVLRDVAEQGISLEPRARVLEMVASGHRLGLPAPYVAEAVIDRLSLGHVQVQGHPDTLGELRLSGSPADVDGLFGPLRTLVFEDLGLRLPPIRAVQRPEVPPGRVAVRVNDLVGIALPTIPPQHLLVTAAPSESRQGGVDGVPAFDPVLWRPSVVVPADRVGRLEEPTMTYTPENFVTLLVYGELVRQLGRLLWLGVVETDLFRMGSTTTQPAAYPLLVRSALRFHSAADVTRLLRSLLEEHAPIRNLRTILETLVRRAAEPPPDWCAEVRLALGEQLAHRALSDLTGVTVHRLDPMLERWAARAFGELTPRDGDPVEYEAMAERVRDVLWEAFRGETRRKVIVATDHSRAATRTLVAAEMMNVTVLADAEVGGRLEAAGITAVTVGLKPG